MKLDEFNGDVREMLGPDGLGEDVAWSTFQSPVHPAYVLRVEAPRTSETFDTMVGMATILYDGRRGLWDVVGGVVDRCRDARCVECGEEIRANKKYPRRLFCYAHNPPPWSMYYGWNPP